MRWWVLIAVLACVGCGGRGTSARHAAADKAAGAASERTAAVAADTARRIVFAERVHDFGTVQEQDGVISFGFRFTNRSDRPVVVTQVLTSCQCIRAQYPKEPVLPGAEGVVTVGYDPAHRPGTFSKEIRILFDGGQTMHRIWIRGEVIPCRHPVAEDHPYDLGCGLRTNLRVLLLGGIPAGGEGGILFRYGNASQQTMRLRFRVEGPTCGALAIPDTAVLAPEDRREVRLRYRVPEGALGAQRLRIVPEVNGTPLAPLELTAVALPPKHPVTASSPVSECPQRNFLFERSPAPQPFAIRIGNRGGSPLHILHADLPQGVESDLRAGAEIAPGASRTFAATLCTAAEYHDRIYVITDDPARPLVTITLNTKPEETN